MVDEYLSPPAPPCHASGASRPRGPAATDAAGPALPSYRFPRWKDASWNSYARQRVRYSVIRDHLGTNAVGAELGVYKGGFGEFLLPHCRKLYLVDTWYRAGGFWKSGLENDSRVQTVIDILSVYKAEIEAGRVEVVVEKTTTFLHSVPDETFDFLYLDSSHRYADMMEEFSLSLPKLRPGGRLFGDDYDPDPASNQHGVFRAVNALIALTGGRLIVNASRQWGLAFD